MSFSFSSLIRLIAFLAIGATMFAVGLSRVDRPSAEHRTRLRPSRISVNECYLRDDSQRPHWLDVESGRVAPMSLVAGDVLEAASCSPWVDQKNRGQVVGRWSARSDSGPRATTTDFGLARYSYPGGELIDHVSTDIMPISPPAWYPGIRARIMYAAGDGRLFHLEFEPDRQARDEIDPRPRPISWRCPTPGIGEVFMSDVQWSDDPRMGNFVVATLRCKLQDETGTRSFSRNQLWWLKLDRAGTSILAAGRLVVGDSGEDHDERSATVTTLPDGRMVASYLRQQEDAPRWQIRLAPVRIDPAFGTPEIAWASTRALADGCMPSPLAFSADGRFLAAVVGEDVAHSRPTRLATDRILFPDLQPLLVAGPIPPSR